MKEVYVGVCNTEKLCANGLQKFDNNLFLTDTLEKCFFWYIKKKRFSLFFSPANFVGSWRGMFGCY